MVRLLLVFTCLTSLLTTSPVVAASTQTTLHVSARAIASLSFKVIEKPSYLRIGKNEDIDENENTSKDRSERDDKHERRQTSSVHELMVVSVNTNNRNGYALRFQVAELSVFTLARIEIKNLGTITLRPGESTQIPVRKFTQGADVKMIKVMLKIASEVKTGTYPWPINVSAIPL